MAKANPRSHGRSGQTAGFVRPTSPPAGSGTGAGSFAPLNDANAILQDSLGRAAARSDDLRPSQPFVNTNNSNPVHSNESGTASDQQDMHNFQNC